MTSLGKVAGTWLALAAPVLATSTNTSGITINNAVFADSLTSELYNNSNECTSFLGLSMAMSLVYPSAINNSEIEMRTTLGYPENSQSRLLWENTSQSLASRFDGGCYSYHAPTDQCFGESPVVRIANSVFVDDEVVLNASYAAIVGDLVQQMDFSGSDAGSTINQWANATTNGLIDAIVEDGALDPWILLAISSIYLKAAWVEDFHQQYTNEDLFYVNVESNSTNDAHFMHQIEFFPYSHEALPGYQVLQLPFRGGSESSGLSMVLVLPLIGNNATSAASANVLAALPNLSSQRVAVALPKFRFESKYEDSLKEALQNVGMLAPFEKSTQNLCIESGLCNSYIDSIIQMTVIDVNEKGVEAAAVTAVGVNPLKAPPQDVPIIFQADRPFQFFLHDQREDLILFEGRVGNPGIGEGSTAALKKKHKDATFWSSVTFTPSPPLLPPAFDSSMMMDAASIEDPSLPTPESNLVEITGGGTLGEVFDVEATNEEVERTWQSDNTEKETESTTDGDYISSSDQMDVSLVFSFLLLFSSSVLQSIRLS